MHRNLAAATLTATALVALAAPASAQSSSASAPVTNDATCVGQPVIFLHGTGASSKDWNNAAAAVSEQGMCPWTIDYGRSGATIMAIAQVGGYGDVDDSAREIEAKIGEIMAVTGAEKVSLVGHSQGGTQTKKYIQQLGHAYNVDRVVTLGATFHGTTLNGSAEFLGGLVRTFPLLSAFFASTGSLQQLVDTPQVTALDQFPDTAPGILYTAGYSPSDTTATPNQTSMLAAGPGADVVNVNVETQCADAGQIPHPQLPSSRASVNLILWGLTRTAGETAPSC
ncbi:esterase/lipase family protein [Corynebacterium doosanense]|uniref:Lipase n=1 Tax=Corynebacterium doosanense CAU 212 = DSM 45436 TaxID=558173 RepID=A0A097IIL3_9CORY|nr:alpha/beta fold hydrolase [Corynebacterium doosanense]AIT61963.1 lipase [Corynebacterium doosanense CAU 212 = DSM 45436]